MIKFLRVALLTVLVLLISSVFALAAPVPPSDAGLGALDSVVTGIIGAKSFFAVAGVTLVEVIAKLIPTTNPQGWLIWFDACLKKAGRVIAQLGSVASAADQVVAVLIPQNLAQPAQPTPPATAPTQAPPATS